MRSADEITEDQAAETAGRTAVTAEPAEPATSTVKTGDITGEEPAVRRPRWNRTDLLVMLGFLVLAVWVTGKLWLDPNGRVLDGNDDDHGIFLFMLAHAERVVFDGASLFYENRFNVPDGVNMMANTSILALALPLAPITHFFGGGVTVVVLITAGLAGTAAAWYWVLSRPLGRTRLAAGIGAAFCGFAPSMVSHANGHVNFVSNYVLPFIVWQVLRLREPGRIVRGGVVLGLLIVLQIFINEEALLFLAMTLAIFALSYALIARDETRRVWKHFTLGLGVAAGTSLALTAYPLWIQFMGKGSYHGQPFVPSQFVTDLASLPAFARLSLFGITDVTKVVSISETEDNTFYGPFGLFMIIVSIMMLWRSAAMRATAIAGIAMLVVSLGPELRVMGVKTGIPLPFALIAHLPVIDLVSVTRFAMVPSMVAGVLLAFAIDRIGTYPAKTRKRFWIGITLALVSLFPKPLPVVGAAPQPAFLTQGIWRQYVPEGRTLVTVPLPDVTSGRTGQRWATLNNLDYATPRGYFMGPKDPANGDNTGSWSAAPRYTSKLLRTLGDTGRVEYLTDRNLNEIRADFEYWRTAVVVLVPKTKHGAKMREVLVKVFGEPQLVGGVEIWQVPPKG